MFGMEKKTKTDQGFSYDIEKELENEEYRKSLAQNIEKRIIQLKELLRTGSSKKDFENLGTLLSSYHALAVILTKACQNKPTKK